MRPPRSILILCLLGVTLITIALVVRSGIFARNDPNDRPINSAMREAIEDKGNPQLSEADARIIAERYPDAKKTPSGLMYVVRQPGTGTVKPQRGQSVTAHYDGRFLEGSRFDSSYERREPFTFRIGFRDVIAAWEEAFQDMTVGERRTIIVPYWLGYGVTGRPPRIPPRATLVFDVELLEFR